MLRKIFLNILYILFLFLIVIIQVSVFSAWSGFFASLNLVILFLVFVLFFYNLKTALITALIFSLGLEMFSFNLFGIHFVSIFASLYLVNKVSLSWLTNRSLYSFILINIFTIFSYQILSAILLFFSDFNGASLIIFSSNFWLTTLFKILWAIIVSSITFNFMLAFNDKYKPDFLGGKMKSN